MPVGSSPTPNRVIAPTRAPVAASNSRERVADPALVRRDRAAARPRRTGRARPRRSPRRGRCRAAGWPSRARWRRWGCRAARRPRPAWGRRCGRPPAATPKVSRATRAAMMLELSPLLTAANASACSMPASIRVSRSKPTPGDRGRPRSRSPSRRNASGSWSMTATLWPSRSRLRRERRADPAAAHDRRCARRGTSPTTIATVRASRRTGQSRTPAQHQAARAVRRAASWR